METFSTLLAICAGNSPVPGEFPTQRPVTRSFDVFFDLLLNKRLSKQWWGWWFETLSRPLWRYRNEGQQCEKLFLAITSLWWIHNVCIILLTQHIIYYRANDNIVESSLYNAINNNDNLVKNAFHNFLLNAMRGWNLWPQSLIHIELYHWYALRKIVLYSLARISKARKPLHKITEYR